MCLIFIFWQSRRLGGEAAREAARERGAAALVAADGALRAAEEAAEIVGIQRAEYDARLASTEAALEKVRLPF